MAGVVVGYRPCCMHDPARFNCRSRSAKSTYITVQYNTTALSYFRTFRFYAISISSDLGSFKDALVVLSRTDAIVGSWLKVKDTESRSFALLLFAYNNVTIGRYLTYNTTW